MISFIIWGFLKPNKTAKNKNQRNKIPGGKANHLHDDEDDGCLCDQDGCSSMLSLRNFHPTIKDKIIH